MFTVEICSRLFHSVKLRGRRNSITVVVNYTKLENISAPEEKPRCSNSVMIIRGSFNNSCQTACKTWQAGRIPGARILCQR